MRQLLLPTALIIAALCAGCVHRYTEPAITEPHAIVRLRMVRHAWAGPELDEAVRLNGYAIDVPPGMPGASTRALRVRPELTHWQFRTRFFHRVTQPVTRLVTERYACGSTRSGYGSSSYTSTQYCSRTVTRTDYVTRQVVDAQCGSSDGHRPVAGGLYILQYDFFGHERCTLRCLRQIPQPGGTFTLVPCGPNEPPAVQDVPTISSGGEAPALSAPNRELRPSSELGAP
jgi:hypothetical protein